MVNLLSLADPRVSQGPPPLPFLSSSLRITLLHSGRGALRLQVNAVPVLPCPWIVLIVWLVPVPFLSGRSERVPWEYHKYCNSDRHGVSRGCHKERLAEARPPPSPWDNEGNTNLARESITGESSRELSYNSYTVLVFWGVPTRHPRSTINHETTISQRHKLLKKE